MKNTKNKYFVEQLMPLRKDQNVIFTFVALGNDTPYETRVRGIIRALRKIPGYEETKYSPEYDYAKQQVKIICKKDTQKERDLVSIASEQNETKQYDIHFFNGRYISDWLNKLVMDGWTPVSHHYSDNGLSVMAYR